MLSFGAWPSSASAQGAAAPNPAAASSPAFSGLSSLPSIAARDACQAQPGAFLRARLRGAATLDIDWHGATLHCDGGSRPDGRGMRVSFSGTDRAHRLLFIFGIDAAPRVGNARNIATNLTVIFEGERRLYSTSGDSRCSVDELQSKSLPVQAGAPRMQVRARGFCVAPATAIGNGAPLLVSRFDFNGAIFLDDARPGAVATPAAARRSKLP
jgi:hypothetical protein